MVLNRRNLLASHIKIIPKTRNRRFREALERNHSKKKFPGTPTPDKKLAKLRERGYLIQEDQDRLELLNWIQEVQAGLGYSHREFANAVGVSIKTIQNWRLKVGYLPSMKNFRRLLELEKLTRVSVVIKKNKSYKIMEKPTHVVVFR